MKDNNGIILAMAAVLLIAAIVGYLGGYIKLPGSTTAPTTIPQNTIGCNTSLCIGAYIVNYTSVDGKFYNSTPVATNITLTYYNLTIYKGTTTTQGHFSGDSNPLNATIPIQSAQLTSGTSNYKLTVGDNLIFNQSVFNFTYVPGLKILVKLHLKH